MQHEIYNPFLRSLVSKSQKERVPQNIGIISPAQMPIRDLTTLEARVESLKGVNAKETVVFVK